jgi:uncharacterized protein (DUF58 family)
LAVIGSQRGKSDADAPTMFALEGEGHGLTDRLPELLLEAIRVSTTVTHGVHGRRRAGSGETFWQFRQFETGDAAQQIDWRRSAATDHLFIREKEWEAAHTVWLWPDISKSMGFKSHLSTNLKRDRALVLMFATAELLVRSGERVAFMGLTQPSASRKVTTRIAEMLAANVKLPEFARSTPPPQRMARFASTIWFSDFLDPIETIAPRIEELAHQDVRGHLVQILDPAEETLPYDGRTEFIGIEGSERWLAERAESLRDRYRERLLAHREQVASLCRRLGWSFMLHHTDRPPAEIMLQLIMLLRGEPVTGSAAGRPSDRKENAENTESDARPAA